MMTPAASRFHHLSSLTPFSTQQPLTATVPLLPWPFLWDFPWILKFLPLCFYRVLYRSLLQNVCKVSGTSVMKTWNPLWTTIKNFTHNGGSEYESKHELGELWALFDYTDLTCRKTALHVACSQILCVVFHIDSELLITQCPYYFF